MSINGTVTEEELTDIVAAVGDRPVFIVNARVPRSWRRATTPWWAPWSPGWTTPR
ncbi:MAG: hypothetical protein R2746_12770 [Acidimicrobiales bacterium]